MKIFTQKVFSFIVGMMLFALNAEAQQVFYESFDGLAGQGGNDGYYDNDATASVEIAVDDLTASDALDNKSGWGDFVKVGICDKCVRLATKKNNGSITTPAITLNGQKATLTFNAAAQLDDDVTLHVAVSDGGQLVYEGNASSSISIHLPVTEAGKTVLANQVYSMEIEGVSGSCQLTFSTESSSASKQRAFLDEIKVVKDTANGISSIQNNRVVSGKTYTLDGREVKGSSLKHGVYIRDGKKIVL